MLQRGSLGVVFYWIGEYLLFPYSSPFSSKTHVLVNTVETHPPHIYPPFLHWHHFHGKLAFKVCLKWLNFKVYWWVWFLDPPPLHITTSSSFFFSSFLSLSKNPKRVEMGVWIVRPKYDSWTMKYPLPWIRGHLKQWYPLND